MPLGPWPGGKTRRGPHQLPVGVLGPDANEESIARLPHPFLKHGAAKRLHLVIYTVGRPAQRELAQRDQILDGVYRATDGGPVFYPVGAPTTEQLQALLIRMIKVLMRLLTRKGYLVEEQGMMYLADRDPVSALTSLQAAACTYRIALGPRAGQKVLTLQTVPNRVTPPTPQRCVNEQGFSLHAEVRLAINQRHKLEHLCRYITRPAIANERLQRHHNGQVVLQLKSPYHDGTTHIVMEPLEFMQRLAALVPRPRLHLIRFHGVLAPTRGSVPRSFRTHRSTPITPG